MSSVLSWLPADGWQRLLCDALWQSTLIGACGWLTARFLIRQSAARSWLLLLTVTSCLMAPIASVAARGGGVALFEADSNEISAPAPSSMMIASSSQPDNFGQAEHFEAIGFPYQSDGVATGSHSMVTNLAAPDDASVSIPTVTTAATTKLEAPAVRYQLFDWIGISWLIASALLIARLMLGCIAALRLALNAQPCNDEAIGEAAAEAMRRLPSVKCPKFLMSAQISTPVVLAIGHPRLLIPIADGKFDWTSAFTHELAHVARGDGRASLWVELVTIALPLSPLVWVLRQSFRIACEEACDDWVIATGTEPHEYVSALTSWINRPRRAVPLPAIGMSITKWRLLRLLSLREKPIVRPSRMKRGACAALALVSIVGFAAAQTKSSKPENTVPPTKSIQQRIEEKSDAHPHEEVGQQAISNVPLMPLYEKRLAENQEYLEHYKPQLADIKSGKPVSNGETEESLRNEIQRFEEAIKSYKERIEKRKAELRSRTVEEVKEKQASKSPLPPYVIEPPDVITIPPIVAVPFVFSSAAAFAYQGCRANHSFATG
jgi:beta-lactamase regulating signal transducer with metallopeptidase domain